MSTNYKTSTAGVDILIPGPSSVEEYDAVSKPGQCLEDAVFNEIYRGTLPTIQDKAMPKLKELTGVAPSVNEKQTQKNRDRAKTPDAAAKVKDVLETFNSYVERLRAQFHDNKDTLTEIDNTIKAVALETPVDPSPTSRAKGPGKDLLEKADNILALADDVVETKVAKLQAALDSEFDLQRDDSGKPTRESLAFLFKAYLAAA